MNAPRFDSQNAAYVQALYEDFRRDPERVHPEWRAFFLEGADALREAGILAADDRRPRSGAPAPREFDPPRTVAAAPAEPAASPSLAARAANLVQAYREHGHQAARIDPLGSPPPGHPRLDPAHFGTSLEALEAVPASAVLRDGGDGSVATVLGELEATYCGALGYEFEHLEDPRKVAWLRDRVERRAHFEGVDDAVRLRALDRLTRVEGLERFLHRAYLGAKRFSVEGTDMLVPVLDEAIEAAARDGATEIVVGMAHRGRLNVLAHLLGVSYGEILAEFEGGAKPGSALWIPDPGTGDVKYHHGATGDYALRGGGSIRVTLAPNPSHLEYVNPVVLGMARARQRGSDVSGGARAPERVVPILVHGDAAFAAEGVVAETLNLARLKGYEVGGTVHVIANNQVGFTTDPGDGRSTRYASDLAKGYGVPVIHANADAPEECVAAARLALAYRAEFGDDAVIDLVGYRRHGHNEGDEPSYTQPTLYRKIAGHPTARTLWAETLTRRGLIAEDDADRRVQAVQGELREAQDALRKASVDEVAAPWTHPDFGAVVQDFDPHTQVPLDRLARINETLLDAPDGFTVHPKLARQLARRGEGFGEDFALDWGHAEALAVGSLLRDGVPVRLSGQDCERGTFSHRHFVLNDAETGERFTPLARVADTRFEVYNSPLTEAAVVGFEYGVTVAADRDLVLWEAQFGDFVNVAQVMIDQFLSSGWSKWGQRSRLTLLLPHGYEGQGPEHSSARLERFLQLCAEDNMRVVCPSTPAQCFHLLRLQAFSEPERPLVVMSPKSLLRHPRATSPVRELVEGSFQRVIDDPRTARWEDAERVRRLVLCTGKAYYDLAASDEAAADGSAAVARIEALYPFPDDEIRALEARYPNLESIVWVQEEPMNMGALTYVLPRIRDAVEGGVELGHVSRPARASPAEGSAADHAAEQRRLVEEAFAAREPARRQRA